MDLDWNLVPLSLFALSLLTAVITGHQSKIHVVPVVFAMAMVAWSIVVLFTFTFHPLFPVVYLVCSLAIIYQAITSMPTTFHGLTRRLGDHWKQRAVIGCIGIVTLIVLYLVAFFTSTVTPNPALTSLWAIRTLGSLMHLEMLVQRLKVSQTRGRGPWIVASLRGLSALAASIIWWAVQLNQPRWTDLAGLDLLIVLAGPFCFAIDAMFVGMDLFASLFLVKPAKHPKSSRRTGTKGKRRSSRAR